MDSPWRIELFGGLRATRGDRVLTRFRTQKTAALFAYLAFYSRRTHPRELLIELFWPEDDPETGRHKLSVALSSLRRELEPPGVADGAVLVTERFSAGLNSDAVASDVREFETGLAAAARADDPTDRASRLIQAIDLYQGDLLPGYYEDWALREQERLQAIYLQALRQLIEHYQGVDDLERAAGYLTRLVDAEPTNEAAHRELIQLWAALGRPAAALRSYAQLQRALKRELDAQPSPATRHLIREIRSRGAAEARAPAGAPGQTVPSTLAAEQEPAGGTLGVESVGGAVPLTSRFYIVRAADGRFREAIARHESIVLVKGPRQVGKSSLLARGLKDAREAGARVVLTDFQALNAAHLASVNALLLALAEDIADQLGIAVSPAAAWEERRGANPNFRRYLAEQVLGDDNPPLVWALDEVDRLFHCEFSSEIFGLFRAWHNERALSPAAPWSRLTLAIAYATEAHLFIRDLNQSPFNVGVRLELADFTLEQVEELNRRYGSPLRDPEELARFVGLIGGHPYLVRRGLHELITGAADISILEADAHSPAGLFGDHLRHMLHALRQDSELCEAIRGLLAGTGLPSEEEFYRLRGAGLLTGESPQDAEPRCDVYRRYLERQLLGSPPAP